MWKPLFQTGEARVGDDLIWGTAMYRNDETAEVVFRRHARKVGISPGHNPPLPDPGADVIPSSHFTPKDWTDNR